MRRLLIGLVVAAATALVPIGALAGNQEVAEQIAARLRDSGQMHGYRIGVKFQDGTAWLKGQVSNPGQMETALKLVSQTPGVQRVENGLSIGETKAQPAQSPARLAQPAATRDSALQQALGALAPEQLPRSVASGMRASAAAQQSEQSSQAERLAQVSEETRRADRVPTSFAPLAAQPVAASTFQQPAVAPPPPPAAAPGPAAPAPAPAPPMPAQPLPMGAGVPGAPLPIGQAGPVPSQYVPPAGAGMPPARYDHPALPGYAWPSYAAHPNYAAVTYPKQYSPTAWPYIGPFYPYPQVPLGWRKVSLEWHDGWWNLDFDDGARTGPFSGLFRPWR